MTLLTGISDLKKLPAKKQQLFESFYLAQVNHKLLPIFADLSLLSVFVGTLFYILSIPLQDNGTASIHPLNYVYCCLLILLGLIHRIRVIRHAAPLMAYFTFFILSFFSYLNFMTIGGGLGPIFGVFFFLPSIGFITISISHTIIIMVINVLLLTAASVLIYAHDQWLASVFTILSNWFVIMCMLIAPVAAVFSRWLYRNLYAMQFLLNDKNELLKETFRTLESTEKQLIYQQKHQALSHMANGLLHEIINPVNSSVQALDYAKSVNTDDDIGEALDEANLQQQRIVDIVADLRSYAQPEEGQPVESINLNSLVDKAIKFCFRELKAKDVEVQVAIEANQMVDCHPTALTQVFVNLLLNACAAFPNNGRNEMSNKSPIISISSLEQPKQLTIRVKDNGAGVESAVLKRITEPFYSGNASPDNIGLGLSICQTIMRHHNGSIDIESKLDEWTEIILTIPVHHSM